MTKLFVITVILSRVDGKIGEGEADYNFLSNDVHFVDYGSYGFGKAMGGKIGIIQDPFGKNGEPKYLGATSPIQGGAVDHLTLGADGTLYADVFMDEVSDQGELMFEVERPLLRFRSLRKRHHYSRLKSSVNGHSRLPGTLIVAGGTFMMPGVWPMAVKRDSRRLSASNELTGKVS